MQFTPPVLVLVRVAPWAAPYTSRVTKFAATAVLGAKNVIVSSLLCAVVAGFSLTFVGVQGDLIDTTHYMSYIQDAHVLSSEWCFRVDADYAVPCAVLKKLLSTARDCEFRGVYPLNFFLEMRIVRHSTLAPSHSASPLNAAMQARRGSHPHTASRASTLHTVSVSVFFFLQLAQPSCAVEALSMSGTTSFNDYARRVWSECITDPLLSSVTPRPHWAKVNFVFFVVLCLMRLLCV